jgi:branched-chain amino acid aminotransferase
MTLPATTPLCWWNGQIVRLDDVKIRPNDRGFTLGDGLFETLYWTGTSIRFFDDHMARLSHGAEVLGIPLPFDVAAIEAGLLELGKQSSQAAGAIRLTLTRGVGARGLKIPEQACPMMLASFSPVEAAYPPLSLASVEVVRAWGAPSSRFKTLSYIDNVVALAMAQANGADDGLMRGRDNHIACATSANLIVCFKERLLTPPVSDGALPGIVRGRLLGAGLIEEAVIDDETLAQCTSACLTNALIRARPIYRVNGRDLDAEADWILTLRDFIAHVEVAT